MSTPKPIHQDEPIRLFKSNFLEFFTHISPITVLVIWVPVVLYCLVRSALTLPAKTAGWLIPLAYLIGLFFWTFAEYILHRFVFHFHAKSAAGQRITFLFHGVHHAQPQCKTRLVMPPVVSIPLAALFFGLFYLILAVLLPAANWFLPIFAGFLTGYLVYDLTHYATHHFPMRTRAAKYLKKYHML
ncbi:MAG: sterol desaturase family protein, partial [Clostridiaceae bacterium]